MKKKELEKSSSMETALRDACAKEIKCINPITFFNTEGKDGVNIPSAVSMSTLNNMSLNMTALPLLNKLEYNQVLSVAGLAKEASIVNMANQLCHCTYQTMLLFLTQSKIMNMFISARDDMSKTHSDYNPFVQYITEFIYPMCQSNCRTYKTLYEDLMDLLYRNNVSHNVPDDIDEVNKSGEARGHYNRVFCNTIYQVISSKVSAIMMAILDNELNDLCFEGGFRKDGIVPIIIINNIKKVYNIEVSKEQIWGFCHSEMAIELNDVLHATLFDNIYKAITVSESDGYMVYDVVLRDKVKEMYKCDCDEYATEMIEEEDNDDIDTVDNFADVMRDAGLDVISF